MFTFLRCIHFPPSPDYNFHHMTTDKSVKTQSFWDIKWESLRWSMFVFSKWWWKYEKNLAFFDLKLTFIGSSHFQLCHLIIIPIYIIPWLNLLLRKSKLSSSIHCIKWWFLKDDALKRKRKHCKNIEFCFIKERWLKRWMLAEPPVVAIS